MKSQNNEIPILLNRDQRIDDLVFEDRLASYVIRKLGRVKSRHLATTHELGGQWLSLAQLQRAIPDFPYELPSKLIPESAFKNWARISAILKHPNQFMVETGAMAICRQHYQSDDPRPWGLVVNAPGSRYGMVIRNPGELLNATQLRLSVWMGGGHQEVVLELFADFVKNIALDSTAITEGEESTVE